MKKIAASVVFLFYLIFCSAGCIYAQIFYPPPALAPYLEKTPEIDSRAAVLIDANTGTILYAKNPNEEIPPASLTKLMTMHIVMSAIERGEASYDEIIPITVESWAQSQPRRSSLMFLEPGQIVTLREILLGLAVSSGNDAAVAAALRFAPSVRDFADKMTDEAHKMGLYVTRFTEPAGISQYNKTTAAEFVVFCREYIKRHPNSLLDFHSVQEFAYPLAANVQQRYRNNPRTILQSNQNSLLRSFPGTDGLKTGYINESGFNIALTAQRDDTRFILVLLGAPLGRGGSRIRANDSARLLSWAFENFKTVRPVIGNIENVRLWKGKLNTIELELAETADFTAQINRAGNLKYEVVIPSPLTAPMPLGFLAGYLNITDEYGELSRTPLITAKAAEKGNIFKRFWHSIVLLLKQT
ncbi:MAG: D-alanyl-D-alanine carboxypeptidase [Treponema sp.]|nr:D-alanyl-D-alanine carboxypeptidase [Treponema sp.]